MNVFIDLGSHFGAITRKFIASKLYSPDFVLHAFEPNPVIGDAVFSAYPSGVIIHREAAWIVDGEIEFYINRNPKKQGSSIHREKITGNLDKENPVKVKTIDFGKWLKNNFQKTDNIIVKSNIEGAEYELFNQMMLDETITYIKCLFLRRHWKKIGMSINDDMDFVERLLQVPGLAVINDYSF
jgi:FkbM family methyltransferase